MIQLRCDLSVLSVYVGESQITQYFSFLMIILLLYVKAHIRNIGKNLLSFNACSTIIHALISCRLERQVLIPLGIVLEHCYLHNNMDADCKQQCIYYYYLCCNHC